MGASNPYLSTMGLIVITNTKAGAYGVAAAWGVIVGVIGMIFVTVMRKIMGRYVEEVEY